MLEILQKEGIVVKTPLPNPKSIEAEFHSIPNFAVNPLPLHLEPFFRHHDVYSYEYNRYKSPHDPDFIIDASLHPTGFIATMGPLDGQDVPGTIDTRPHFWQMIHETKSRVIVMVTDLKEGERPKCSQYWPDTSEQYGRYFVEKIDESKQGNLLVRHFDLEGHPVTHIHLLHWPDNSAFSNLDELEAAIDETRKCQQNEPVVVHCSAGVGRTGCFIACYIIKLAHEAGLYVDLKKLVTFLREQGRVRSVQELSQYKMLYDFAERRP